MQDENWTVRLTAANTGIKEPTLRFWRHLGDRGPKSFKLGGKVMYKRSDVEKWMQAQYDNAVEGDQLESA